MLRMMLFALPVLAAGMARALDFFSIGAGEINGAYFAAARAICEQVNRDAHGALRCSPEATQGSLANLSRVRSGDLEFGLVQSDWHRRAVEGRSIFAAGGPVTTLRSVLSLHAEPFTLLVRRDADVTTPEGLSRLRVDLGHPSSGRRATTEVILEALGLTPESFAATFELQSGAAVAELCAGRIDATLLVIGHPNATVARALRDCDARIAPLTGPSIETLIATSGLYQTLTIPGWAYPELNGPVATFGVTATLVARDDADPRQVTAVVQATLGHRATLARRTPVLRGLDPDTMSTRGLSAPLHPAAAQAFEAAR